MRKHIIKQLINQGQSRKSATSLVARQMRKPNQTQDMVQEASDQTFSELRICCFTTQKENLLFWSHYADSHKGFCVEFNSENLPISYAFKVRYQNEYPEFVYPTPTDDTAFIPALIKSPAWEYENEFRIILVPEAESQPRNDGESLLLNGDEIRNIYFGANITKANKELLLDLISKGPFRPRMWNTRLSETAFSLEFEECR